MGATAVATFTRLHLALKKGTKHCQRRRERNIRMIIIRAIGIHEARATLFLVGVAPGNEKNTERETFRPSCTFAVISNGDSVRKHLN